WGILDAYKERVSRPSGIGKCFSSLFSRENIMSRFYQVALGAGVSLALGVGTASGALLSHEDFDYPDGGLSGKNNYAPGEWSSAWGSADPQPFSVASGSLMDPSGLLPTSGGHSYSDLWASDLTKPVGMNRNLSSTTVAALNGAQT